jgi:hypothetical protein
MHGSVEFKNFFLAVLKNSSHSASDINFELEVVDGVVTPILIKKSGDFLSISKYHAYNDRIIVDIAMSFRIKRINEKLELWPIFFQSIDGKLLNAEFDLNGKVLTNAKVQGEIIDIADNWGKSLLSQFFVRNLANQI